MENETLQEITFTHKQIMTHNQFVNYVKSMGDEKNVKRICTNCNNHNEPGYEITIMNKELFYCKPCLTYLEVPM